jgi:hypothetical protein
LADASNHGIKNSVSEYIHLHDDDDSVDPSFYDKTSQFLDLRPCYGGVVCSTMRIEERLTPKNIIFIKKSRMFDSRMAMHVADILVKNQFAPISFVFRRYALDTVGYYDNSLPVLDDWDFNLRFSELFDIGSIDEYLSNYHFRIPTAEEKTPQTVTASSMLHEEYSAIIRNRILRNAKNNKQMAFAVIMSHGRYHQLTINKLKIIDDYVRSTNLFGDFIKRLIKRYLNHHLNP